MDAYTRYPVVHMTKSTKLTELKKALTSSIHTLGRPAEVWSDGGPPYNSHEQNPEEQVAKYVAAYRSTPHSVTGYTPNKLMFNREITTKLPRVLSKSQAKHHRDARKRDEEAKAETQLAQAELGELRTSTLAEEPEEAGTVELDAIHERSLGVAPGMDRLVQSSIV